MYIFTRFAKPYDGVSLPLDTSYVAPNHVNIHANLFISERVFCVYVCILYML